MPKSRFLLFLLSLLSIVPAQAQNPVKWSASFEPIGVRAGEGGRLVIKAKIDSPWYIYAPSTPPGGPNPTSITLMPSKALAVAGKLVEPPPIKHLDEGFGIQTFTYKKEVDFGFPIKVKAGSTGAQKATLSIRYQTCNQRMCLPPKTVQVPFEFKVEAGIGPAR